MPSSWKAPTTSQNSLRGERTRRPRPDRDRATRNAPPIASAIDAGRDDERCPAAAARPDRTIRVASVPTSITIAHASAIFPSSRSTPGMSVWMFSAADPDGRPGRQRSDADEQGADDGEQESHEPERARARRVDRGRGHRPECRIPLRSRPRTSGSARGIGGGMGETFRGPCARVLHELVQPRICRARSAARSSCATARGASSTADAAGTTASPAADGSTTRTPVGARHDGPHDAPARRDRPATQLGPCSQALAMRRSPRPTSIVVDVPPRSGVRTRPWREHLVDGPLDVLRRIDLAEVAEHHRAREDHRDRVRHAAARDVGGASRGRARTRRTPSRCSRRGSGRARRRARRTGR